MLKFREAALLWCFMHCHQVASNRYIWEPSETTGFVKNSLTLIRCGWACRNVEIGTNEGYVLVESFLPHAHTWLVICKNHIACYICAFVYDGCPWLNAALADGLQTWEGLKLGQLSLT